MHIWSSFPPGFLPYRKEFMFLTKYLQLFKLWSENAIENLAGSDKVPEGIS